MEVRPQGPACSHPAKLSMLPVHASATDTAMAGAAPCTMAAQPRANQCHSPARENSRMHQRTASTTHTHSRGLCVMYTPEACAQSLRSTPHTCTRGPALQRQLPTANEGACCQAGRQQHPRHHMAGKAGSTCWAHAVLVCLYRGACTTLSSDALVPAIPRHRQQAKWGAGANVRSGCTVPHAGVASSCRAHAAAGSQLSFMQASTA